jgi:hypothetical protein
LEPIENRIDITEGGLVLSPNENNRRAQAFRKLASTIPPAGTNVVIITHKPNILDAFGKDWFDVKEGAATIFTPDGSGYKLLAGGWTWATGLGSRTPPSPNRQCQTTRSSTPARARRGCAHAARPRQSTGWPQRPAARKKIARAKALSGSAVPHRPHKCSRRDKIRARQPIDVER